MTMIYRGILLIWMSVPVLIFGSSTEELQYHFSQDDSSYSFRGSFIAEAELDCLISLVYDFEHISKYASGATAVELIRQEDNWNEVRYTYRKFIFFENKSTWRRTLNRDNHELVFEMISSENNLKILPDMLSSSGYYRISPEEKGYRMEYFQECCLDTDILKDSYINKVKKEAIEFLLEFREYVEKTCVH
jgi:hypothetical protein